MNPNSKAAAPAAYPDTDPELTRLRARVAELETHRLDQGDEAQESAAPSANGPAKTRDASRQLFEQAPLPLLGLSRRGRIVRANRQATEALSGSSRRLKGVPLIRFLAPTCRPAFWRHLKTADATSNPSTTEITLIGPDQRTQPVAMRSQVVSGMAPVHLVCSLVDSSEAHSAELQQQQISTLETEAAAKVRFLSVLSHELRTPLTPVTNLLAAMRRQTDLPDRFQPLLEMMDRNLQDEIHRIDELLQMRQTVRGELQLVSEPLAAHDLLEDIAREMPQRVRGSVARIRLALEANNNRLEADRARLSWLLTHLLEGILEQTPATGRIRVQTQNPAPHQLAIEISELREGFNAEDLKRAFEAVAQIGRTTGDRLGLGLPLAQGVIKAHGGSVQIRSCPTGRGGQCLVLTLPLPTHGAP